METPIELKHLRARFVSDFNLPIQVIVSPYFEDRLILLEKDYGALTAYNGLLSLIDSKFDGDSNKFLEYYHQVRDKIIVTVTNSDAYKDFISNDKFIKHFTPICGNRNLYTNEQDGCMFISYDMKQANFQTLRYANPCIVCSAETYEEFIGLFTHLDYIKKSKYTRQVIFGKMNPKRTMNLEKWITNEFAKTIEISDKCELFSLNADEIILKWNGSEDEFDKFEVKSSINFNGVEFKGSKFKLHARQFKLATSDSILTVYEKEDYLNGHRRILKDVPATYMPQVYKLLSGMEIKPSDLKFYFEHQICSFDYSLTLIK
jgi:hypothetical protein